VKTIPIQVSIAGVCSGCVTSNYEGCGVRAPRNNKDGRGDGIKTIYLRMLIVAFCPGVVVTDRGSCGVRAPPNNKADNKSILSSKVKSAYENENHEGKQKENHTEGTQFESQDAELGQDGLRENKELSPDWQTVRQGEFS
jgi:hypothetical protein